MSSYHKTSKPVIIHDDHHQHQRQPSADSYYSRSSTGSSASHSSTMPNGNTSSSGQATKDKTYRAANSSMVHPVRAISEEDPLGTNRTFAGDHLKKTSNKDKVTVVHHYARGWDENDPHPEYKRPRPQPE